MSLSKLRRDSNDMFSMRLLCLGQYLLRLSALLQIIMQKIQI